MKITIDLVDDLYELLNVAPVTSVIADIFPDGRPDNHRTECISINCLPVSGDQLQRAVVNVNIICPNLKLNIAGQPDNSQPNRVRLKQISDVVIPIIKDAIINNTVTQVQNITMVNDKELKEHFLNIRILTNSINL